MSVCFLLHRLLVVKWPLYNRIRRLTRQNKKLEEQVKKAVNIKSPKRKTPKVPAPAPIHSKTTSSAPASQQQHVNTHVVTVEVHAEAGLSNMDAPDNMEAMNPPGNDERRNDTPRRSTWCFTI